MIVWCQYAIVVKCTKIFASFMFQNVIAHSEKMRFYLLIISNSYHNQTERCLLTPQDLFVLDCFLRAQ